MREIVFKCKESIAEGFVAWGVATGAAGTYYSMKEVFFACQGSNWEEMENTLRTFGAKMFERCNLERDAARIRVEKNSNENTSPMWITPGKHYLEMLNQASKVFGGRSADTHEGIFSLSWFKTMIVTPNIDQYWKPELCGQILERIIGLVPEPGLILGHQEYSKNEIVCSILDSSIPADQL